MDHLVDARRRVFCLSLADWLDNEVPIEWLVDLLRLIHDTPQLDWLMLSKRIGNWEKRINEALNHLFQLPGLQFDPLCRMLSEWLRGTPVSNIWLGATVVNQEEADRDIPKLLAVPARVRFLSIEPMLGPVCIERATDLANDGTIDWVIAGGESGPKARPAHPDWFRALRDECEAFGAPFLFNQWGSWRPAAWFDGPDADRDEGDDFVDLDRTDHQFMANDGRTWDTFGGRYMYPPLPLGHWCLMVNEGKKTAGRLLDGREHNAFPGD